MLYLIRWKGEVLLWLTRTTLYSQDLLPLKTTNYLQLLTIDIHELRLGPGGHVSIPSRCRLWNLLRAGCGDTSLAIPAGVSRRRGEHQAVQLLLELLLQKLLLYQLLLLLQLY